MCIFDGKSLAPAALFVMRIFYNLAIALYSLVIRLCAPWSSKAKHFCRGRKDWYERYRDLLSAVKGRKRIWMHCASLGEFEQGRPVLEALKKQYPDTALVLTFFSPSGYEVRKDYKGADLVLYLPLDTPRNAERFVKLLQPELALFVKYEFWYHYISVLYRHKIPVVYFSAIFQPRHIFFKWYGGFFRRMLYRVSHFFVQNEESKDLLEKIGIGQVSIAGDTRFDRAIAVAGSPYRNEIIERFTAGRKVLVAGSTWPGDETLLRKVLDLSEDYCLVIAPHEIDRSHIDAILHSYSAYEPLCYNQMEVPSSVLPGSRVLIVDSFGVLAYLYRYADAVWIGGGFNPSGIHNTVEAAVYGKAVLFGPRYKRFREAYDMLALGGAASYGEGDAAAIAALLKDHKALSAMGDSALQYVALQAGATERIVSYIVLKYLSTSA